jgi:6-methylsalicylate decarboxylase
VFAMLAGGAPLLSERLTARGGPPIELRDPLTFYETSSYGPVAIEATAARVGAGQLLYGSDRPVIEPIPAAGLETALQSNAAMFADRADASAVAA